MFSSIRQKFSDLFANPADDSSGSKISLLEKIGGVFNFTDAAPPSKINSPETAFSARQ